MTQQELVEWEFQIVISVSESVPSYPPVQPRNALHESSMCKECYLDP